MAVFCFVPHGWSRSRATPQHAFSGLSLIPVILSVGFFFLFFLKISFWAFCLQPTMKRQAEAGNKGKEGEGGGYSRPRRGQILDSLSPKEHFPLSIPLHRALFTPHPNSPFLSSSPASLALHLSHISLQVVPQKAQSPSSSVSFLTHFGP